MMRGAALSLALSFAAVIDFVPRALERVDYPVLRLATLHGLAHSAGEWLLILIRIGLVALLALTIAAGLFGTAEPVRNLAPTMFWVVFWVGTAFLATPESLAHPIYKQRIVEAGTDDTEYRTGYSYGWKYGTPHRVIPSGLRWNALNLMGGGARAWDADSLARKLPLYAGQGVGRIVNIRPAADIVAELAEGFGGSENPYPASAGLSAPIAGGNHVAI